MKPAVALTAVALLAAGSQIVRAEGVRTEKNMSLEIANLIAAAGVAACAEKGYAVVVTVVDRAGTVRAVQRADNAGPHSLASAERKAWTAASMKTPTQALMETAQKNPGAANLVYLPGVLLLGGGVPVKVGNETIGAVGIGGAPGGHLDDQCAVAAIDKVKDLLK